MDLLGYIRFLVKEARLLPPPRLLSATPRAVGRVLSPVQAGSRLASGAPALPSHMDRARRLMQDTKIRGAAEAATGGELTDPTGLLAMGLRGSGGRIGPAMDTLGRIAKIPKQTVQQARAPQIEAVESRMASFADKLKAAREAQLARVA